MNTNRFKIYDTWVHNFFESWKNLEGAATANMIAPNATYYENPIDNPCEDIAEIRQLWAVVPSNQRDVTYAYDILSYDETCAIVHFRMRRFFIPIDAIQHIDGIFQISINEDGLCTYFKQWRFTK